MDCTWYNRLVRPHWSIVWLCYLAMGYMQMGIVTFMHDCTHSVLFKTKWKNWVFGVFTMIPLVISFTAFKEDHLLHHRFNRSNKDPDAFTMGKRGIGDYILFMLMLSLVYYWQLSSLLLFSHTEIAGVKSAHSLERNSATYGDYRHYFWMGQSSRDCSWGFCTLVLAAYFLWFFNSVRFVAEHYGTPWNAGQLAGTRTIISNPMNSWFWNNINYHIGHHVYPAVPWYNLQRLHVLMLPEINRQNALIDKSYFGVFFDAMIRGPESLRQNIMRNEKRNAKTADPVSPTISNSTFLNN